MMPNSRSKTRNENIFDSSESTIMARNFMITIHDQMKPYCRRICKIFP